MPHVALGERRSLPFRRTRRFDPGHSPRTFHLRLRPEGTNIGPLIGEEGRAWHVDLRGRQSAE